MHRNSAVTGKLVPHAALYGHEAVGLHFYQDINELVNGSCFVASEFD